MFDSTSKKERSGKKSDKKAQSEQDQLYELVSLSHPNECPL